MYRILILASGGGPARNRLKRLTEALHDKRDDLPAVLRTMAAALAKSPQLLKACVRFQVDKL
jgi:hypothetical protein